MLWVSASPQSKATDLPGLRQGTGPAADIDSWLRNPHEATQLLTLPILTRHRGTAFSLGGAWRWVLLAWLVSLPYAVSAATAPTHNVLMLFANGRLLPANVEVDRGMTEVFSAHSDVRVDLSVEFLDAPKFGGPAFGNIMATYLHDKYASRPPEVVIVAGEIALDFVLASRATMFPGAPVVYLAVNTSHLPKLGPLPDDVIGVAWEYDFPATVELARRWHPRARRLAVVTGTAPWDKDWEALARSQAKALDASLEVEFLAGLPSAALKQRLGELGSDTVVFTPGFFRDGDGGDGPEGSRQADRRRKGRAGVRSVSHIHRHRHRWRRHGQLRQHGPHGRGHRTGIAGRRRTCGGRTAEDHAESGACRLAPGAQIRHRAEAVPANAVVSFKEPSFWEAYGHFVLIAGAVMLVQSALIASLLIERRRRRRTASALAQSEQRMSLAAHAARLSMWSWNLGHGTRRSAPRRGAAPTTCPAVRRLQARAGQHASAGSSDGPARGGPARWPAARR